MKRHTCKYCGKKRNEIELTLVRSELLKASGWICKKHTSKIADISDIRPVNQKPVLLELFSGSGHVSERFKMAGFETITLDNNAELCPDIVADILNLRNCNLPGSVDVVFASVPCTWFSILNIKNHWDKISLGFRKYLYIPKTKEALNAIRILNATLKLIRELNPTYFFIENPRGALRHFPQMEMIPYRHTVSYADYGFDYYKPTDIWTNCPDFKPIKIKSSVGQTFDRKIVELPNAYERSLVPPKLTDTIIQACSKKFGLVDKSDMSGW